ncbi:conserved hypothetical protein [Ricinus communis]|uniref:Uncharacterized protein n=1 Tax=Ricinus communis TaxID=3988 RepID=B9T0G4_RICCO|nr:conserved hypothetical protein [Ricinus communis]
MKFIDLHTESPPENAANNVPDDRQPPAIAPTEGRDREQLSVEAAPDERRRVTFSGSPPKEARSWEFLALRRYIIVHHLYAFSWMSKRKD